MTPPDDPGAPPPPPYPTGPSTPGPRPAAPVATPARRGRSPVTMLVIGLLIGIILGAAGGYFAFNGRNATTANLPQATPSPSPSASIAPTPTASPAPAQTPVTAPQGVVACSVGTPTGQHPLGTPGGPGSGQARTATLVFCGGGNATIPTGTARFLTGNNWGLGIADSCPVGSSGQSGMNTVLTVTEVIPGGGQGPDTATEPGDWVEGGSVLMAAGGSYQLRVTTVSPSCVWDIAIYPTS